MPNSAFTRTLLKVLHKVVKKAPTISELVEQIQLMTYTLFKLDDEKESVSSRISAWDRLKFLSTTKEEREEKDLKARIKILEREIESSRKRLHSLLVRVVEELCLKRDDFRLLRIWDYTLEIKQKIRFISCSSCDEGFASVMGDMAALAAVSRLQAFLDYPGDESVSIASLIEQEERDLLGSYY
ncbi:MAG: hypothetical protein ACFFCO_01940 [Promethearchaeota archaeon]